MLHYPIVELLSTLKERRSSWKRFYGAWALYSIFRFHHESIAEEY